MWVWDPQLNRYVLVALHPEGVDRNRERKAGALQGCVAFHPEGAGRTQIVTLDFWT